MGRALGQGGAQGHGMSGFWCSLDIGIVVSGTQAQSESHTGCGFGFCPPYVGVDKSPKREGVVGAGHWNLRVCGVEMVEKQPYMQ